MELHLFVLKERKKYIPGAADFGTVARRGHGFHTRPFFLHEKTQHMRVLGIEGKLYL